MLSSQVAVVSQTSTFLPTSLASSAVMLRHPRRLCRRSGSNQQIRSFRFGLWSSYLDPIFRKELQHRHRVVKHKYIEALHRKLSWDRRDRQIPEYARHMGLKGFMCSAWHRQDQRPGGRWVNVDKIDEINGEARERRENGVEDVDGSARDKILKDEAAARDIFRTRLYHRMRWSPLDYSPLFARKRHEDIVPSEKEYEIDPITNRKVFKTPTAKTDESTRKAIEVPVKTFKGYRSQFEDLFPPTETSQGESGREYTSKGRKEFNDSVRESLKAYEEKYNPSYHTKIQTQPDEKRDAMQEGLRKFDAKMSYDKPFLAHEPDGKKPEKSSPVEEGLKSYDNKTSYDGPFLAYEPDGQPSSGKKQDQLQEGLHEYDAKASYNQPFLAYEPDGNPQSQEKPDPVQEGLKGYDSRTSYKKPFLAYEPDGNPSNTENFDPVQEGLKGYDARTSYKRPFLAYEPDGNPADHEAPDPVQEGLKNYDSKTSYDEPFISRGAKEL
ncbi:hypothetical protein G7Y89_g1515 [Cudoniella acicularis]|uniref:Uncharacterized protein n=1 Tax=Cudoniella acicularis TaxID=354080 RepID=A0A8H4RV54_9HELO|nr:hypothetical protein G7Y89_g1515 [Cudoniella acicularis]